MAGKDSELDALSLFAHFQKAKTTFTPSNYQTKTNLTAKKTAI